MAHPRPTSAKAVANTGEQHPALATLWRQRVAEEEDRDHQHGQRGGEVREPPLRRVGLLVGRFAQTEQPIALPLRGLLVAVREPCVALGAELRAGAASAPVESRGADHGQRAAAAFGRLGRASGGDQLRARDRPRVSRSGLRDARPPRRLQSGRLPGLQLLLAQGAVAVDLDLRLLVAARRHVDREGGEALCAHGRLRVLAQGRRLQVAGRSGRERHEHRHHRHEAAGLALGLADHLAHQLRSVVRHASST
jgi:hypothetical protein